MPVPNFNTDWKACGRCKVSKAFSFFGRVKGVLRSYCRECHRAANFNPDARSEKPCSCCKLTKPTTEFGRMGARYQSVCSECQRQKQAKKWSELKEAGLTVEINQRDYWQRRKWIRIKAKYGLTKERFLQMIEEQGNLCAICKQPERESSSPHTDEMNLSVDHCHKTGKVRGLLCRQCNIALGRFREDVGILQSAIAYLQRYA